MNAFFKPKIYKKQKKSILEMRNENIFFIKLKLFVLSIIQIYLSCHKTDISQKKSRKKNFCIELHMTFIIDETKNGKKTLKNRDEK